MTTISENILELIFPDIDHAISLKYTFICWEIKGSITVMCNYLWLVKIIFNVKSSTFFNFQNVYSDEFPKFKWYTWRNFLKKNLSRWKMGSENVHTYNMLTHQMRDLLIHSFHFLYIYIVFWLLVFSKFVWSYLGILSII